MELWIYQGYEWYQQCRSAGILRITIHVGRRNYELLGLYSLEVMVSIHPIQGIGCLASLAFIEVVVIFQQGIFAFRLILAKIYPCNLFLECFKLSFLQPISSNSVQLDRIQAHHSLHSEVHPRFPSYSSYKRDTHPCTPQANPADNHYKYYSPYSSFHMSASAIHRKALPSTSTHKVLVLFASDFLLLSFAYYASWDYRVFRKNIAAHLEESLEYTSHISEIQHPDDHSFGQIRREVGMQSWKVHMSDYSPFGVRSLCSSAQNTLEAHHNFSISCQASLS